MIRTLFLRRGLLAAACSLALFATSPGQAAGTLYDDLGGKDKITAFTNDFVEILLKDPRIKDFFADPTLTALARRVVAGAGPADIPAALDDDRDEGVL